MRPNLLPSGLMVAALAAAAAGLVTAQESQLPPIPTPPEETAPIPTPPTPGDPAAEPAESEPPSTSGAADPAPYKVLGPDARAGEAEPPPEVAAPPPEPEVVEVLPIEPGPPPPLPRRPRHAGAIVQALDKVTAETMRFEVAAGRPVRWKSLVFKANACETEALNEPLQEAAAHLLVTSEPRASAGRAAPEPAQVFRGWMFASSPGLNPFEHPVYDVWLVGCRKPAPVVAPGSTPPGAGTGGRPSPAAASARPTSATVASAPAPQTRSEDTPLTPGE